MKSWAADRVSSGSGVEPHAADHGVLIPHLPEACGLHQLLHLSRKRMEWVVGEGGEAERGGSWERVGTSEFQVWIRPS